MASLLHQAALTLILEHVPLQQRLHCALVCTAWAEAAAASLANIDVELNNTSVPAFQQWLNAHCTELLSLSLPVEDWYYHHDMRNLQLQSSRLSRLQQLHLERMTLELLCSPTSSSGAGQSGSMPCGESSGSSTMQEKASAAGTEAMLTALVHLDLRGCSLPNPAALLLLAQAQQLTSLRLDRNAFRFDPEHGNNHAGGQSTAATWEQRQLLETAQVCAAMARLLERLPQLSVLELMDVECGDAAVQQMSALTRLQDLSLPLRAGMCVSSLQSLPGSITKLYIEDYYIRDCYSRPRHGISRPSLPAQLPQLTALQELSLCCCVVPPTVLAGMTQLQRLDLEHSYVSQAGLATEAAAACAGVAALFAVLPKLQQLRQLRLRLPRSAAASTPLTAFSVLTASSHLTELAMSADDGQPLPAGAVQHMFARSRKLPQLKSLDICSVTDCSDEGDFCLNADGLAEVVACCPGLERLAILSVMAPGADVSALLLLPTSCTRVDLGPSFTDAAAGVVAQLTHLRELSVEPSSEFSLGSLLKLTALKSLTWLCVDHAWDIIDEEEPCVNTDGHLILEASCGPESSVWAQLLQLCARNKPLPGSDAGSEPSDDMPLR